MLQLETGSNIIRYNVYKIKNDTTIFINDDKYNKNSQDIYVYIFFQLQPFKKPFNTFTIRYVTKVSDYRDLKGM